MDNREIEAKFLEIDKEALILKLKSLNAEDLGEDFLREMIFYDAAGKWVGEGKTFVRIREITPHPALSHKGRGKRGVKGQEGRAGRIRLTYKNLEAATAMGTEEVELAIENTEKAKVFLEKVGLLLHRQQEKKRHTFKLGDVIVDIDTWPSVPAYVEIEGSSEDAIKEVAEKLGFDYSKGIFANSRMVLEKYYNIPVGKLKYFTFGKIE